MGELVVLRKQNNLEVPELLNMFNELGLSYREGVELITNKIKFGELFTLISIKIYTEQSDLHVINNGLKFAYQNIVNVDEGYFGRIYFLQHMVLVQLCEDMRAKHYKTEFKENEHCYRKRVIENFNIIFPEYEFEQQEKKLEIGRLDILAKEIKTGRDVIIELKIDKTDPVKQLLLYGSFFENPILVSLSPYEYVKKHPKVIYKVFK